jgi:hypothetical protein
MTKYTRKFQNQFVSYEQTMQIQIFQSNCWVTFETCWEFDLNMNMINNKLKSMQGTNLGKQ